MPYMKFFLTIILTILISYSAQGYIGPGMSGGLIVAVLGTVFAIFAALFGIIYYPLKRFLKKKKSIKKID